MRNTNYGNWPKKVSLPSIARDRPHKPKLVKGRRYWFQCEGGPFDGKKLNLDSEGKTALIRVGKWLGRYRCAQISMECVTSARIMEDSGRIGQLTWVDHRALPVRERRV